jgi:hypothetical protein
MVFYAIGSRKIFDRCIKVFPKGGNLEKNEECFVFLIVPFFLILNAILRIIHLSNIILPKSDLVLTRSLKIYGDLFKNYSLANNQLHSN